MARLEGRIFRAVTPRKADQALEVLRAPWLQQLIADGEFPQTFAVDQPSAALRGLGDWLWLEHAALPFPCYPHEITALQLYDSAHLTLKVATAAALGGWILKDASAWNVLHSRGRCVFVDLLSFERQAGVPRWMAYGQFARHFLLPLMIFRRLSITPPDVFMSNRDGVTPERAYELLRVAGALSPDGLELVLMPKWFAGAGGRLIEAESRRPPKAVDARLSEDLLVRTLARLGRTLERLHPDESKAQSTWNDYEEDRSHYSGPDLEAKKEFVRRNVGGASQILDIGCNAGEFSLIALGEGRSVVSADFDHPALGKLYRRIRGTNQPITPVLLNLGRPTPAVGWLNREIPSFLDRAAGQFDCVLFLGLIHHLLVTERASLPMLAELLAHLGPRRLILEWIDPTDRKFRQLSGVNHGLYELLNAAALEECFRAAQFDLVEKLPLPCGTRVMYVWRRRGSPER